MFHPGHHELHGVTVVGERATIHTRRQVHLLDVGVHDAAAGGTREDFVRRSARFGVRSDRKHLVVPLAEVARITPLGAMES